ncbi:hypothetical protein HBI73_056720 [Parastagonospora nodorum]|nr:hypothetical protein HBH47_084250 [Parastagonospora nodorum]KAH4170740.1 hypothetical protein HBH43_102570 [Parastagonospora nodorum]KAH4898184.1 hypothetical protein HBI80_184170 [Parastagonospora nodorum]KAH5158872.1 hypothetical protein HBI73_056720 [Parastagonospora nodorum]KAH5255999.1 hypothetical protein HBI72_131400 [Parastagonospora nodorum]
MLNLTRCSFHYCCANIGVVMSDQRLLGSTQVGPARCDVPSCTPGRHRLDLDRASMLDAVCRGPVSVMDLTCWWSPFMGQYVEGRRIELA